MAKDEAKIKFRADTSGFNEDLSKAKDTSRQLTSQMKLLEAEFGNTGDKTTYLSEKQKNLKEQLAVSAEKVTALNGKLEAAKKHYGDTSHEAQYWATEVNKAKTAQENLKTALNNVNKELQENANKEKAAQSASEQLSQTIAQQESKLSQLKTAYVDAVLQKGKDSTEAKQLADSIRNLNTELDNNKTDLKNATDAADELGKAYDESGDKAKGAATGGYTVLKNVVANLATDVFQRAIQSAKEFAVSVIDTGKEFYASMSNVQALSGATGKDFDDLTAKAKEMGAETRYTAKEAADAMGYMALAGWDAGQMIDGINPILNLAAANNMDLATASDIVTDDLTAFGLEAKDAAHFSDVLAITSAKSNTNIEMMGEAFQYAGSVCGSMGYSIEDAALAIGTMANSGIKASQAGTTLRSIITRLATDAGASSTSLGALGILTENLGVEFYDSAGQARDLSDVLEETRKAWAGLTAQEQAEYANKIAGKTAIAGFLALMSDEKLTIDQVGAAIEDLGYDLDSMGTSVTGLQNIYGSYNDVTATATELVNQFGFAEEDASQIAMMLSNSMTKQNDELLTVTQAVESCGVSWEKYADAVWASNGAANELIDNAMYNLTQGLFESEDGIAEYVEFLQSEYDMTLDDAQAFTDAFIESAASTSTGWDSLKDSISNCNGAAQEMSDTMLDNLQGDMTLMSSALDGLKLKLFDDVNSPLRDIVQCVTNDVIPAAMNAVEWVEQHKTLVSDLGTVLGVVAGGIVAYNIAMGIKAGMEAANVTSLGAYVVAQISANTAMLACPITWIVAGITALVAVVVLAVKHWDDITAAAGRFKDACVDKFGDFKGWCGEHIAQPVKNAASSVKESFGNLKDNAVNKFGEIKNSITQSVGNAVTSAKQSFGELKDSAVSKFTEIGGNVLNTMQPAINVVTSLWQNASNTLKGVWEGVGTTAKGAWEVIKNATAGPVLLACDAIVGDWSQLASDAQNIWNNMGDGLKQIGTGIKQTMSSIASGIKEDANIKYQAMRDSMSAIGNSIAATAKSTWSSISTFFVSTSTNIKESVVNKFNAMKDALPAIWDSAKNSVHEKWTGIKSFFTTTIPSIKDTAVQGFKDMVSGIGSSLSQVGSTVAEGFSSAIDYITSLPGRAVGWGKDFVQGLIDGIKSKIGSVRDAASNVADNIRSFLHFSVPDEGPLTDYESWMPDFIGGLASGIEKGRSTIKDAVNSLASDMVVSPDVQASFTGYNSDIVQKVDTDRTDSLSHIEMLREYIGDAVDERIRRVESTIKLDWLDKKLDRLIEATEASGDMYLDGEKISRSIAPSSDKINGERYNLTERGVLI